MNVKIFGREPVVIVNFVEGGLAFALAFGMLQGIGVDTAEEMAVIMAVVASSLGVYIAYVTRDTLLGALTGFAKAGIALGAAFGYDLTATQTSALLTGLAVLMAMWHSNRTGPASIPSLDLKQHSVVVPLEGEAKETVPAVSTSGAVVEKPVADPLDPGV